jgi:aldose sugar dehydrogenase
MTMTSCAAGELARRHGLSAPGAMLRVMLLLALPVLGAAVRAEAQVHRSERHSFRVDTVVGGLEHPWSVAILPDGGMLVTERPGRLRLVRPGGGEAGVVAGVPEVAARGQGGLLEVTLHPDFATNRYVYLTYSKPGEGGATTALARGRLGEGRLEEVRDLFVADAWSQAGAHFGSRVTFGADGKLYMTVGERGNMANAQNLGNHAGKVLRLNDDGTVPADNPLVTTEGARPEIYAYGIRSPQGLTRHPATGELWETEHGPRGGDEVNLIRPGRNYGWPVITYGINYNGNPISDITAQAGMEQPLHYWVPSIATSGLTFYTGSAFPEWRGNLFAGGLAGMHLARLDFDGTEVRATERLLDGQGWRIRDVRQGPDGMLYLVVDAPSGLLLRLTPGS